MQLLEAISQSGRAIHRVGDAYEITKKPRDLKLGASVSFLPMDGVNLGGEYGVQLSTRPRSDVTSGVYFERGDILVARITPSFENGKQAWARDIPGSFAFGSTELIPLRPRTADQDRRFLFFYLLHPEVRAFITDKMEGSTGRQRVPDAVLLDLGMPAFSHVEQNAVADVLELIQSAVAAERASESASQRLKRAAMRELFTRGLRGEARKESEIGPIPASWSIRRLDNCATAVSTRMQYSELEAAGSVEDGVRVLGIKVSDMNAPGNEVSIVSAILERHLSLADARRRCAPPLTIVFPKRGAAIATNKKRITSEWTVFDPNVIGVIAKGELRQDYLFQWFQQFDLRTITEPGPTPQLNKKNLDPLLVPIPSEGEQHEIVAILDAIDRKIALHKEKRAVLEALFKSLLHKLMIGEVRVADLNLDALGRAAEAA